jgi:hypothetical protein
MNLEVTASGDQTHFLKGITDAGCWDTAMAMPQFLQSKMEILNTLHCI